MEVFANNIDNGTPFWSDEENHCDPNDGCENVEIVANKPVVVQVLDENNTPPGGFEYNEITINYNYVRSLA